MSGRLPEGHSSGYGVGSAAPPSLPSSSVGDAGGSLMGDSSLALFGGQGELQGAGGSSGLGGLGLGSAAPDQGNAAFPSWQLWSWKGLGQGEQ
jgi:hypothetical protein